MPVCIHVQINQSHKIERKLFPKTAIPCWTHPKKQCLHGLHVCMRLSLFPATQWSRMGPITFEEEEHSALASLLRNPHIGALQSCQLIRRPSLLTRD